MILYVLAGTDTSRFTLHWCLCYLAANPEIQDKVFKEIAHLCGNITPTILIDIIEMLGPQ